jgi:putative pyruvate formate lyase activating enzyme
MLHIIRKDSISVLDDANARASLSRYFAAMQDEKHVKFRIAKKFAADFDGADSIQELWRIHEKKLQEFTCFEREVDNGRITLDELTVPHTSFLDLKNELASRILENCHFCARRCNVNRIKGQRGYCRCGTQITVSSLFEHLGEEPELVPSGTIFTLGCTIRCLHCQNWAISQWFESGEVYTPTRLALAVEQLRRDGCRNANLVGGEPTPWLQQWLQTFQHVGVNVPVVWNSNTYYSEETASLLAGFADVYLLDFKYGNNECAERISNAPNYLEVCKRNHLYAKKHGELIIRVLVLPGHLECCTKEILNWIAENLGKNTRTNIMFQYRPQWRAHEVPELRRRLTTEEMRKAAQCAKQAGLANCIT